MKSMPTQSAENYVMKGDSKIKLSEDNFVLVGMDYNYHMILKLAYPKGDLKYLRANTQESEND